MIGVQKLKMNQHSLLEGDSPGQIIRLAPYEPRDSQGRTLEVARYQDRSHREADVERRLNRTYRPLLLLDRACDLAARVVLCSLPFSALVLWFLVTLEMNAATAFGLFCAGLVYSLLYPAWIASALEARLRQIRAEAQANGIELELCWRLPSGPRE